MDNIGLLWSPAALNLHQTYWNLAGSSCKIHVVKKFYHVHWTFFAPRFWVSVLIGCTKLHLWMSGTQDHHWHPLLAKWAEPVCITSIESNFLPFILPTCYSFWVGGGREFVLALKPRNSWTECRQLPPLIFLKKKFDVKNAKKMTIPERVKMMTFCPLVLIFRCVVGWSLFSSNKLLKDKYFSVTYCIWN